MNRATWTLSLATVTALATACGPVPGGGTPQDKCPVFAGPTTHHTTITADETWTAAASPHLVTFGIIIEKGATLTIEPCAEVRFKADYGLVVRGRLVSEGTGTKTIHFTADDAAKPWSYIGLNGGTASFASTLIENGGSTADPNGWGVIDVRGDYSKPRQELLHVQSTLIKGSQQFGVVLRDGATFTADSSGLSIEGAKRPIRTSFRLAGNIPKGKYTGNTVDEIVVSDEEVMSEDTVFHDRGIPYRMGDSGEVGSFIVGVDGSAPRHVIWTLEPAVTVKVIPGGRIATAAVTDASMGAIVAQGTPISPVIFTSASPAPGPGDWVGLWFNVADILDHLDWVHVEFAGGPSYAKSYHCDKSGGLNEEEDAALILFGLNWSTTLLTNSTITGSAGYGIDRAWSGDPVDFLLGNSFSGIAKCKMSYPRDSLGNCPSTVPCP
jgi:hypothetical protein